MAMPAEYSPGQDEYPATQAQHEHDLLAELRAAGFTEEEQVQFMQAWDANDGTLTPQWRFLLLRYESYVYPERA